MSFLSLVPKIKYILELYFNFSLLYQAETILKDSRGGLKKFKSKLNLINT